MADKTGSKTLGSQTQLYFRQLLWLTVLLIGSITQPALASPPGLDLTPYRGKVVYIDFWASWCAPCRQSFPYLTWLKSTYGEKDLVVITVNVDHSRTKADAFLQEMRSSDLTVVYDADGQIASSLPVKGMPTSILIDRNGQQRFVHTGFFQEQIPTYNSHVTELLSEK